MLRFTLMALLVVCAPSHAAISVESLRQFGVSLQGGIENLTFSRFAEESERDVSLRLTRKSAQRAYRVKVELQMIGRSAAETQRELSALAKNPQDQARQDRVESLLRFMMEALPKQEDALSWISGILISNKYHPPEPNDTEFIAAIKEMNRRIIEADEAGKKVCAAINAIDAQAGPMENLSERAQWLSARLADYANDYAKYSAHVREQSEKLVKKV